MTLKEFILKIKKRIHYKLANKVSIETYFMPVINSTKNESTFSYYGHLFYSRLKNSSDYNVAKQVLVNEEYKVVTSYFKINKITVNSIIDAGSNIGLTTIYFKRYFQNSKVYCIEPDNENFRMLNRNLNLFTADGTVKTYNAGLMGKSGLSLIISSDFRGGSDWAKQTIVSDEINLNLKSITIPDIINENQLQIIDILKIDIEGAETFLINNDTDTSFLKKTRCVAIEIHDEFNCRDKIHELLIKENFILIEVNEMTFAINKNFI